MAITAVFVDVDSFTIVGDQTSFFCVNRRVVCDCGVDGEKFGTILSSSYSSPNTTVNLTVASQDLTSNLEAAKYSKTASTATHGLPVHSHTTVSGLEEGAGGQIDHTHLANKGTKTHTQIDTHVNNLTKHRLINDAASGATNLWSAQKIQSEITTISGKLDDHNEMNNIQGGTTDDYYHLTSAQHTDLTDSGDCSIHKHDDLYYTETELDAGQLDDRYYTETEVDTISGSLSAEIDSDVSTAVAALIDSSPEVLDTLNELAAAMGDDADFVTTIINLITTTSGDLSSEIDSDISTHSSSGDHDSRYYTETELNNGQLDNRYYTETEADALHTTLSGNLSDEIDSDIVTFSGTIDHDTILNAHNLTTDIDHESILNTHNLTTDIDHGSIVGLGDDDHTIYSLVDGTRDFTDEVVGVTPTASGSLATKWYVDQTSAVAGIPTGTKMYFYQNTAPTGWTIDAAVADTVLAIKGGSQAYNVTGGQIVGTWTQPNHLHTTGSLSLSIAQMPAHAHTCALWGGNDGSAHFSSSYSDDTFTNNASTSSVGSGSSHNHGNTGNGATANTYRPEAAIGIIATKD